MDTSKMNSNKKTANEQDEKPATFDHLVVLLMSSDLIMFDKSFVFSFFLSSRVFMSPDDLLMNLFEKTFYYMLHHKNLTQKVIKKCISRFLYIVNQWSENFPSDFRDVNVAHVLASIENKFISMDKSFTSDFANLFSQLAKQISSIEKHEESLKEIHDESKININKNITNVSLINICYDPILLAKQLTHIEMERLSHIGPEEFMYYYLNNDSNKQLPETVEIKQSKICNKNFRVYLDELKQACQTDILIQKTNYSTNILKRTSNLLAYILWFNRLSSLVCTEIVKNVDLNRRIDVMKLFIDTAYCCYQIGNFNSAMSIIAGLQSYQVTRLKKTWSKIDLKKWEKLTFFTDSSSNYINYRNLFKETRLNEPNKLLIPVFSLVMKDLNFYFNNIPNSSKKGCLKISKFWQMSRYILENITKENLNNTNYPAKDFILKYLLTEPLLTEEACFYLSFQCEPASSKVEIERLNSLKNKLSIKS